MKVLVIGADPAVFNDKSESFRRVREYAGLFDELHIVAMSGRGFKPAVYGDKLFVWPTNSFFYPLRWIDAFFLALKIIKKYGISFIDAQDPGEAGLAAYMAAKKRGLPLRLQIHTDIFSPYYRRASWKEAARYLLAVFLIPRADCIRAVSERIRRSLTAEFPITRFRISVLPVFTDTSAFFDAKADAVTDARFRNYVFKMIAVGRFVNREKNFSLLIEMMREFVKICPAGLLILAGDGPDRRKYESAISRHNLGKNVIIEPWRSDLPSFYKSFDLCLMPSNYEGWGRTAVEAMASGIPVVMTDAGLAGEAVKNGVNGIVVPAGNKKAFLEAVRILYENPEERKRLASSAQESVKNLKPATKEEYLALYRESFNCRK